MTTRPPDRTSPAVRVSDDGERRVYTRRLRTVHVVLLLIVGVTLAVGPTAEFVEGDHALAAAIAGTTFAVAVLGCVGLLRQAIVVTPGQVAVRGLCTTRRIAAVAVARFEPPVPYGKRIGRVALRIVLVDGRALRSRVFTNTPLDGDGVGVRECDELNEWLALQAGALGSLPRRVPDPVVHRVAWGTWLLLVGSLALFSMLVVVTAMTDPAFGG